MGFKYPLLYSHFLKKNPKEVRGFWFFLSQLRCDTSTHQAEITKCGDIAEERSDRGEKTQAVRRSDELETSRKAWADYEVKC